MDAIKLVDAIRDNAPKITIGGKQYFVVENDRKVPEAKLLAYANEIIKGFNPDETPPEKLEGLVAATDDGKPMRWGVPAVLGWKIDESTFEGKANELEKAKDICYQATEDWNDAAKELGIFDAVHFEEDKQDPLFQFAFSDFGNPNLYAVAFFPNDPASERVVNIGPTTFIEPNSFDPVGVIRHELGHVLGFRHEHIRPEAQEGMSWWEKGQMEQWVSGTIGAEVLTNYDSQSVMHYPLNGGGTLDFELSDADKAGFKTLYTLSADDVREFSSNVR